MISLGCFLLPLARKLCNFPAHLSALFRSSLSAESNSFQFLEKNLQIPTLLKKENKVLRLFGRWFVCK